jgi:hypothetical protein
MATSKRSSDEIRRLRSGKPNKNNLGKHRKSGIAFPVIICATVIVGIVVGVKSYHIAYNEVSKYTVVTSEDEDGEKQFSANNIIEQAENNLVGSDIDGVIKDISYDDGKITFYSLKSNETVILTATEDTQYPFPNTLSDYKIGDVVTFVYNKDRNLTDIKACEAAWEYSDTGLVVNTDSKLVKFGDASTKYKDKSFKYTDGITTVRYKDVYSSLDKIDKLDYVTVRGYDNGTVSKAYSITIEKSHGSLEIHNGQQIQDGVIKLNGQELSLDSSRSMNLTEGRYTIEVTGSNCEDYSTEVMIKPSEVAKVDLSVIQIKSGLLNVSANVHDYTITIDGVTYNEGDTILLDYGKYSVTVRKEDYQDFNGSVTINEDVNTLSATLKERDKLGTLRVTATPSNAKIYVDGTFIGQSPQSKDLPLGSHKVEVKLDGYISESRDVNIANEGETSKCDVSLTPVVTPYSSGTAASASEDNTQ